MSLDIGDIVRKGFSDAFSKTGLELVAALFVVQAVVRLATTAGVNAGAGPAVIGLLTALSAIAGVLVTIGTIRLFTKEQTGGIESLDVFTEEALMKFLNLVVGAIVFGLAVAIGLALLVVPGLILLTGLAFWQIYVVTEDSNFIEAMRNSWDDTHGHKWSLLLLGIVMALIGLAISLVFGVPGTALSFLSPSAGAILMSIGGAINSVLTLAVLVEAFKQATA